MHTLIKDSLILGIMIYLNETCFKWKLNIIKITNEYNGYYIQSHYKEQKK
jgi:hypothetical protein